MSIATLVHKFSNKAHLLVIATLMALLFSLAGCGTTPAAKVEPTELVPASSTAGVITLGKVSDDPAENIREWGPLVNYLADNLQEFGIGIGEVKISSDTATMGRWMENGEVDLFIDSFYSTMVLRDAVGATPILFRQKGKPDKHAVFFARADSSLQSLDDLLGETISLDDPESASGFMLPVAYLLEQGVNPVEKADAAEPVGSAEVGYVFSGDDEKALRWVADGLVTAAAVDNETFEEFSEENPGVFSIIAETEPVFRDQLLMASPSIDEPMRAAITSVLLNMSDTAEGQAILEELSSSTFKEFLGEREEARSRAEAMYLLVSNHIQMVDAGD